MIVVVTQRSTYLVEPDLRLLLQVPGGTDCGIAQGVWHRVLLESAPRAGTAMFCSVQTATGDVLGLRTSPVTWVGPPPAIAAYVEGVVAAHHDAPGSSLTA